jgi:hypothetical protein
VKGPVSEISLDGLADGLIVFLQNFFDGVEKVQPCFQRNKRFFQAGPGLTGEYSKGFGIWFKDGWMRYHGDDDLWKLYRLLITDVWYLATKNRSIPGKKITVTMINGMAA